MHKSSHFTVQSAAFSMYLVFMCCSALTLFGRKLLYASTGQQFLLFFCGYSIDHLHSIGYRN